MVKNKKNIIKIFFLNFDDMKIVTFQNSLYGYDYQFIPSNILPEGLKRETTITFLVTGFLSNYQTSVQNKYVTF